MSVSTALSSAKRRRAGNVQEQNSTKQASVNVPKVPMKMSVQDVIYMFNDRLQELQKNINTNATQPSGELVTQVTDSIDNMNTVLELFSKKIASLEKKIEETKMETIAEKLKLMELKISDKVLSENAVKGTVSELVSKVNVIEQNLTSKTEAGKAVAKPQQAKTQQANETKSAGLSKNDAENVSISFSGLKDKQNASSETITFGDLKKKIETNSTTKSKA